MNKELIYSGYTANTSDYECGEGELSMSLGVLHDNGLMRPIMQPSTVMDIPQGYRLMYVHERGYRHYIATWLDGAVLHVRWSDDGEEWSDITTFKVSKDNDVTIHQTTSIGNTLVMLSSSGVHYALWKDDTYKYLGNHLPECPITFSLQGTFKKSEQFSVSFDSITKGNIYKEFSDDNKEKISEQVLAKVNKFIADESVNAGKFMFPFFVRYAYRMYDGTLTMHSSPVLMVASSRIAPIVYWNKIEGKDAYTSANLEICTMVHDIDYAVYGPEDITALPNYADNLKDWSDIISSVDVFISAPIYTYNQAGECQRFSESDGSPSYCICKPMSEGKDMPYAKYKFNELYAIYNDGKTYPLSTLVLPERDVDDVANSICNCAQFYLLASLKIEDIKKERTKIEVDKEYLQSLTARELMTDDYDSHDNIIADYAHSYNSRLNLSGIKKDLFHNFHAVSALQYTNGKVSTSDKGVETDVSTQTISIATTITHEGKDIVVRNTQYDRVGYTSPVLFFYYPNINAVCMHVSVSSRMLGRRHIASKHNFLNGSYFFAGWDEDGGTTFDISDFPNPTNPRIDLPSKIYTSEVNNPFYFPVLGINTVGTGNIIGISSAAKAMSEGQFGQFPLYAFTTEGVWALEVSANGSYSARQPITRDVCINAKSITQIDSAVLFATDRGIMHISGSTAVCMSDVVDTNHPFDFSGIKGCDTILRMLNHKSDSGINLTTSDLIIKPFKDFLLDCRILYDYPNQQIIVYNPSETLAYVYSLESRQWGMMLSGISDNIPSYPEALAVVSDSESSVLVDFSKRDGEDVKILIVTRPLKLDAPNIFKTVDSVIQRGYFERDEVKQVLYGSNDLFNWFPIWSSDDMYLRGFSGSPYKFHRLVVFGVIGQDKGIFGSSIQYNPKMLNKPR